MPERSIAEALFLQADRAEHEDYWYLCRRRRDKYLENRPPIDAREDIGELIQELDEIYEECCREVGRTLRKVTIDTEDAYLLLQSGKFTGPFPWEGDRPPANHGTKETPMKTYDIHVIKRGIEHYSVRADSPEDALKKHNDGATHLKDDETTDIYEVKVIDRATGRDVTPAEPEEDHGPIVKNYGVRCWATFRAFAGIQVEAFNFDGAMAVAKTIDWDGLNFSIETMDGDETVYVFGPEDADAVHDDPWNGDGVEIDLRADGEPFSWVAVAIVKELAALASTRYQRLTIEKVRDLMTRAAAACGKDVANG